MTTYSGADNNIQRKVRRAYAYIKDTKPEIFASLPGENLSFIFKAIFIALDEDYKDTTTVDTTEILIDTSTVSTLNPVPNDPEV